MFARSLLSLVVAGGLLLAAPSAYGQGATPAAKPTGTKQQDSKKQSETSAKKSDGVSVGDTAPAFTLTDTDGKTVNLSDYKDKIVVLQWFNAECPHVAKHYGKKGSTFNDLHKDFSGKDVVFLAVNSGAAGKQGSGKDLNAKYKKEWNQPYPILLDENGTVGKAYGATRTPDMYIIGKDGKVAYKGGIDNNKSFDDKEYKNYVRQALNQLVKGETVTEPETKSYGCGVKYAN